MGGAHGVCVTGGVVPMSSFVVMAATVCAVPSATVDP